MASTYLPKDEQLKLIDEMIKKLSVARDRIDTETLPIILRKLPGELTDVYGILAEMDECGFFGSTR